MDKCTSCYWTAYLARSFHIARLLRCFSQQPYCETGVNVELSHWSLAAARSNMSAVYETELGGRLQKVRPQMSSHSQKLLNMRNEKKNTAQSRLKCSRILEFHVAVAAKNEYKIKERESMSKQMRCFNVRVNIFFPKKQREEITELEIYFLISWYIPFQQPNIKNIFLPRNSSEVQATSQGELSKLAHTTFSPMWNLNSILLDSSSTQNVIHSPSDLTRLTSNTHSMCVRYSKQHLHRTYAEEAQTSCLLRDRAHDKWKSLICSARDLRRLEKGPT